MIGRNTGPAVRQAGGLNADRPVNVDTVERFIMPKHPDNPELKVVNGFSRRTFLSHCPACAAAATCAAGVVPSLAAADGGKVKLRLVFTHIPPEKPTWPNVGYDYEGRKKVLTEKLRQACPNVEFLPATAMNAEEGRRLLDQDSEVDGYLVYMLGLWTGVGRILANAGKRCIFADDLYGGSGEFLGCYAAARRKGQKVVGVSSTRFEDVAQAVRIFETIRALRSDVVLDVLNRDPGATARAIEDVFGTKVRQVTGDEINEAYRKADVAEGKKMAQLWIKAAQKVVEPKVEEIEKSGRMYVAMNNLMEQYKSRAIAMDCLGLFYAGKLEAYPCLGFFHLNNEGKVGACEADLRSTISMLAMGHLVGRPGYISDPVIDTSKNQIIYAHCVAPSKVYGPNGKTNPYHIRSHSEDRKGAAVRSLMPVGEIVTSIETNPVTQEIVIHTARTVANIDEDKACRTKIAAEVKDIDRLLGEWDRWGWHRVTFYGDYRRQVAGFAALAGFRMVEEG